MAKLKVGQSDRFFKTISESDVYAFAGISGDLNRFHVDEEYAKNTFFQHRIAHGVLLLSFVSTVLGTKLPGPGAILTSITAEFKKPAYFGDTITAEVTISQIEGNKVTTCYGCKNQDGKELVTGSAIVTVPKNML